LKGGISTAAEAKLSRTRSKERMELRTAKDTKNNKGKSDKMLIPRSGIERLLGERRRSTNVEATEYINCQRPASQNHRAHVGGAQENGV